MNEAYYKAMALADGELDSGEIPALVQKLARDPALLRAFQSFVDLRRNRVSALYAGMSDERAPEHLVNTAEFAPMGRRETGSAGVLAYSRALLGRLREEYRMPSLSFAAGAAAAAVVAIAVSFALSPREAVGPAAIEQAQAPFEQVVTPQVEAALERATSREDNPVPGMRFLQTYWSKNSGWCRQFDIAAGGRQTSALACRGQEGAWRVVLQTPPVPVSGGMIPAASAREHLDRFVQSHMKQPALEPEQARQAAASGWQPPGGR
jgi:hypothetical protein